MEKFVNRINLFLQFEKPIIILTLLTMISVGFYLIGKTNFKYKNEFNHNIKYKHQLVRFNLFTNWRQRFENECSKVDNTGLVSGIFLGSDQNISQNTREEFYKSGLTHLLAASGFNCFIVAISFTIFLRLILHFLSFHLSVSKLNQMYLFTQNYLPIIGAWLFFFWSDQSPPILRSSLMITVTLILNSLGILPVFSRSLLIHYLFFLIFSPWLILSASFELTFGCLFGILLMEKIKILKPMDTFLKTIRCTKDNKIWHFAIHSILTSIGACLGTIPTTWLLFDSINFTSIFTNFFAVPITTFLIMPFSLVAMLILIPISSNPFIIQSKLANILIIIAHYSSTILLKSIHWYNTHGIILQYVN